MIRNTLFVLTVAALVGACASAKVEPDPTAHIDFHPVYADTTYKAAASGAIFNPAGSFDLFMDLRARAVGDILTIALDREDERAEGAEHLDREEVEDRHGHADHRGRPDHVQRQADLEQ